MLLDFLESKECTSLLQYLVKHKGNGNNLFTEECITKELNHAFFSSNVHYEWNVALDRFMMHSDIKLFLMGIGCFSFDDLNEKEKKACFHHYGGTLDALPD